MTAPSDEELEQIETDGYYSVGEGSSVPAARRALYNAGYAAGLKDAREVCMALSVHPTQNQSSDYICAYDEAQGDCADAIAKLELDQEN